MSEVNLKKGMQVQARTLRGTEERAGKIVDVQDSLKGKWYEIKPNDGTDNFKTRAGCITPA